MVTNYIIFKCPKCDKVYKCNICSYEKHLESHKKKEEANRKKNEIKMMKEEDKRMKKIASKMKKKALKKEENFKLEDLNKFFYDNILNVKKLRKTKTKNIPRS